MSLLIDLVKTLKGKSREKVSPMIYNARVNICTSCPLYNNFSGSCGTLLSPKKVDGKLFTCGCIIRDKAQYADDACPQDKW